MSSEEDGGLEGTIHPIDDHLVQDDTPEIGTSPSGGTGLVSARGTSDGLILRMESRAEPSALLSALREFLEARKGFLRGSGVQLEWVGSQATDSLQSRVVEVVEKEFGIALTQVQSAKIRLADKLEAGSNPRAGVSDAGSEKEGSTKKFGLFGGLAEQAELEASANPVSPTRQPIFEELNRIQWDDADARVCYETLRSGQRLESEHTLIVFGDVNSGAEVVSGGDIVVLGKLKGVAHAGAYEESGGGRCIFSLEMDPIQLRIGSVISRGDESPKRWRKKGSQPEVARVDTDRIIVEAYKARPRVGRSVGNL